MGGWRNTLKLVHNMSVDIRRFVAAVQNWFERFGACKIIDFTTVLECNKHTKVNIITIIINILPHTVFQLQCVRIHNNLKYTHFSL
jgi:hypothetical protein